MVMGTKWSGELPNEPGAYRLWMDLPEGVRISVGALGEIDFPAGRYAYVGSARRGIRGRVSRHLRSEKRTRWHIDYLLHHAHVEWVEAHTGPDARECTLAGELRDMPGARIVARGFGSSDCRCPSHLVWVPAWVPYPISAEVRLRNGERLNACLLRGGDGAALGAYFGGLSERTRARYGPHAFDQATADSICASLDPRDMLRVVAWSDEGRIVAYMLVKRGFWESDGQRYASRGIPLDPETTGSLAPSVADHLQNQGVASALMPVVLTMVRSVGIRRLILWGGVIADNHLAQGFYRKWGFRKVGEFTTSVKNYDMMMDLDANDATVL